MVDAKKKEIKLKKVLFFMEHVLAIIWPTDHTFFLMNTSCKYM